MINTFCTIKWGLELTEWDAHFNTIRRSTLLQSAPYAFAMRQIHQQKSRFGLILMNGVEAGLVRLGEAGLFQNTVHAVTLDRGPLWFDGFGSSEDWRAFIACFESQFPKRFLRKRRVIAETSNPTPFSEQNLIPPPYQTIWLDLTPSTENLRKNLKQKWRNTLNKAEKIDQTVCISWDGGELPAVLHGYGRDRLHKKYAGASIKFLNSLCSFMISRQECLTLTCSQNNELLAAILIFIHGSSATYQMGWTSRMGRNTGAHHLLLWRGVETLCHKKILDFDLGGINDNSAAGVKAFKQGLGGHEITLIGRYE